MEARDTPAQMYWCPDASPSVYDRFDWRTGPSVTAPYPSQPPVSGDVLYFTGELSDADCPLTPLPSYWNSDGTPGPIPTVGQFYGVQLYDEYAGVVDFRCSAFVGGLSVGTPFGTVRQSDPGQASAGNGGQITVQMALSWTGGTLNDSPLPGFLNLVAPATGTIAPTNEGTVNLGSTITLFGHQFAPIGSTLTVESGTINLNDGDGFVVKKRSRMKCAPVPKQASVNGEINFKDNRDENSPVDGYLKVEAGAEATVEPINRPAGNTQPAVVNFKGRKPVLENFGAITMKDRADVRFLVDDPANPNADGFGQGYQQSRTAGEAAPILKIEAGCFLTCDKSTRVVIVDGTVELAERRAAGVAQNIQPDVTVRSAKDQNNNDTVGPKRLVMLAGTTLKRADADPQKPITLNIVGGTNSSFECAATIELYSMKSQQLNDKITATGKVVFFDSTTVSVIWFASDNGALRGMPATWTLVKSEYKPAMAADAITATPAFTAPPVGNNEALALLRKSVAPGLQNDELQMERTQ